MSSRETKVNIMTVCNVIPCIHVDKYPHFRGKKKPTA